MDQNTHFSSNPMLDLSLERIVDVPKELIWNAWTQPELLMQWFTPSPWKTVECQIDLRPGGIFQTRMQGPEGQDFTNTGCFLSIKNNEQLIWTGALGPDFRPKSAEEISHNPFLMTAMLTLETVGSGTKYTATVIHGDETARQKHEQMGFHVGWGIALDQLIAMIQSGKR